jgi:hypothetical protein
MEWLSSNPMLFAVMINRSRTSLGLGSGDKLAVAILVGASPTLHTRVQHDDGHSTLSLTTNGFNVQSLY